MAKSIATHGIARYGVPVPEGRDGECVTLCDDCYAEHPEHAQLEWLEDKRDPEDCAGDDCPNLEDADGEDERYRPRPRRTWS